MRQERQQEREKINYMKRIRAFVIVDTNVFVSALITNSGHPFEILKLIEQGNVIPIFDKRILSEYYRVFHYDKFSLSERQITKALYMIIYNGIFVHDVQQTREKFIDSDDIPFFEVKESTDEFDTLLVTGNIRHFPADSNILTPHVFLALLNQMERFIQRDFDYEMAVQQIISDNLEMEKYSLGKDLAHILFDDKKEMKDGDFFSRE